MVLDKKYKAVQVLVMMLGVAEWVLIGPDVVMLLYFSEVVASDCSSVLRQLPDGFVATGWALTWHSICVMLLTSGR